MKKLNSKSINTPEHYNMLFEKKKFKILTNGPIRAIALMKKFIGGRFLDIGCGLAPHSMMAQKIEGSEVYAIDFSDKLIESLKARFPGINYMVGDIRDLPYESNYFDYAVLGEVLEHMDNPSKFLKEIVRVIKPGGILALSVPFNDKGNRSPVEHTWSFLENDIRNLLIKFGETEVQVIGQGYRSYIIGYLKKSESKSAEDSMAWDHEDEGSNPSSPISYVGGQYEEKDK